MGSSAGLSRGRSRKARSICSSIVAVSSDSASALGSSGENAESVVSEASTVCISPVAAPSVGDPREHAGGSSSASSQPSRASPMNSCMIPSVACMSSPE